MRDIINRIEKGVKIMKNKFTLILLSMLMTLNLVGCGNNASGGSKSTAKTESAASGDKPETNTITWAQGNSGNVLVSIAKEKGYFDEVGLKINEIPLDDQQLQAVVTKRVDIASNSGTNGPIQMISSGDDMAIIGGFMLTGCMPIIAKEGKEWKGPESLLGSKFGGQIDNYSIFHVLSEAGHDLKKEIKFVQLADGDKIAAVQKGELDYAVLGTGRMYQALNTKGVKIVAYNDDITPNYSCCRMVARDSWVKKNPTTVKLLNMALIRAQAYFESHRKETVSLMAKQLRTNEDYVKAYMLNEHYRINPDPVKNVVLENYKYLQKVGGLTKIDNNVNLKDRIYTDLYKQALDEAVKKYGHENPEFYKNAVTFYEKNNL